MYRQGDVLLVKTNGKKLTGGKRVAGKGRVLLAEGEATGHSHTLPETAELYELDDKQWVIVPEASELVHQEHDAIVVAPGTYWVVRQREYTPQAIRRVSD